MPDLVQSLSDQDLRKLYRQSIGIYVCAGLWGILSLLQIIGIVLAFKAQNVIGMMITPIVELIFIAAAYGSWARLPFGRIMNIVIFSILLLGIPLGTLVGILGLMVNVKAGCLFGDAKIAHTSLVDEKNRRHV